MSAKIISDAASALKHSSHPSLRRLDLEETEVAIVIRGQVTSYYLKQLAQETLMPVRGPRKVENQVVVNAR